MTATARTPSFLLRRPPMLEAEFELLSPAFLGGADQSLELRQAPELRVPSIRGALRAWLRALDPQWREIEGRLFGNTAQQGVASLSVTHKEAPLWEWKAHEGRIRSDWRVGSGVKQKNGLLYLAYVFTLPGNEHRRALPASTRFRLRVLLFPARLSAEAPTRDLTALLGSIWALGHLGALGMRARRGFGSLQLTSWSWRDAPPAGAPRLEEFPLLCTAPTAGEAVAQLGATLTRLRATLGAPTGDVPHLGAGSHVLVLPAETGAHAKGPKCWEACLQRVGLKMQTFRASRDPDRADVRDGLDALNKHKPAQLKRSPQRVGFGLPLTFRFLRSGAFGGGQVSFHPGDHKDSKGRPAERWASPVRIRLLRTAAGLHPLVLRTGGLRPASGRTLMRAGPRTDGDLVPPAGIDLTDTFIQELRPGAVCWQGT